jgi:plasmid stabilization system protein ParE
MRVRFTPRADRQYLLALRYLLERNPSAAVGLQTRVEAALTQLREHPESGHAVPEFPDMPHRELPVEPYRLFHRIVGDTVWIVAIWHARQLPEEPDEPGRG